MRNKEATGSIEIKRKRHKWVWTEVVSVICLTILTILIVIPFWNGVVVSFETGTAYANNPFSWLPGEFTLDNYKFLTYSSSALFIAYRSTIVITIVGTLVGMTISTMAAYAFSRQFPGKRAFFLILLFTMFFEGGTIPMYLMLRNMGLLDSYVTIVLLGLVSGFNIIIMKNSFDAVPLDLQDAAMIDGANDVTIFARVMLPLQRPMIATFSLFTAVGYWNTWYWPLLILNSGKKTVLQLYLRSIVNTLANAERSGDVMSASGMVNSLSYSEGVKMAAVIVVMLPIMLVYPFLQKYFIKGMLVGAVKM